MIRQILLLAPLCIALPAQAQSFELLTEITYADYSEGRGDRQEASVIADIDFGDTSLVIGGATGKRDYGTADFSGSEGSVDLYHDWNDTLTTRTSFSLSSDDPVFANRTIAQEIMVKPADNLVLTGGIGWREYFGDVETTVWSLGPTYYFRGGFVRYTYSDFDIEDRGNTHSHLATVRVNDGSGRGYTQAWLGTGTSIQEYEFVVPDYEGDVTGAALRRVQPVSDTLDLTIGVDYQDFDTPLADYERWGMTGGVKVRW